MWGHVGYAEDQENAEGPGIPDQFRVYVGLRGSGLSG